MRTVGGTLVSRILGVSKWGGPLSAYFELAEGVDAPRNDSMGRGKVLERSVLSLASERLGMAVQEGGRLEPAAMPYAHASLDALAYPAEGPMYLVEAKTLALEYAGEAWGEDGSDKVATEYHLQALWYLGVARAAGMQVHSEVLMPVLVGRENDLAWASRMVERTGQPLTAGELDGMGLELRLYRIPWDGALFAHLDARVRHFLRAHVEAKVPPAPGEGDVLMERDLHAVQRGFKAEKGRVVDFEKLAGQEQAEFLALLSAVEQRKAWEKLEEQAKARVQLLLGSVEEVRGLPGGARVTWKATKGGARRFEVREPKG